MSAFGSGRPYGNRTESLPVTYFASSFLNGASAECVGKKFRCVLNAEYAKRIRSSMKTGDPHFKVSVALGATDFRMARSSRSIARASFGAAATYSATVFGFGMREV